MSEHKIVLYHYPYSPYARRVLWYLALRGLDYSQCVQPPVMPRPDVAALGVSYRRIPVLALGRDVYCDTRIQLPALDSYVQPSAEHPSLAVHGPEARAIASLISKWTIEGGLFARGAQLLPPDLPALMDPKFQRDREDFSGRSWKKEDMLRGRPEALVHVREVFDVLEDLLGDNREWICRTASPSIADIESVWLVHWITGIKGALDEKVVSATHYPKVYAWRDRFDGAVKEKSKVAPKPTSLEGDAAAKAILQSSYVASVAFDNDDPLQLRQGDKVEVFPTDSGSSGKDVGKLVALNKHEVAIEAKAQDGTSDIRIHFPRSCFRIKPLQQPML